MKKAIFAAIAIACAGYTNAQSDTTAVASNNPNIATNIEDQEKTPLKVEELPDAVRKALASDTYAGWTPAEASLVKSQKPYYEIIVVRGEEKMVVNLDSDGKKVG